MRGKAITTSSMAILLQGLPTLDDVADHLTGFQVIGHRRGPVLDPRGRPLEWPLAGPGFVAAFRPEVRGEVYVDVIDRPWPEEFGSTTKNPSLNRAWLMGRFGPFAYPDGLRRAVEQACWEGAGATVGRHFAFIRLCSTYGDSWYSGNAKIPEDYEPVQELEFMTELAVALSSVSGAVAYFNPAGEVLCLPDALRETWQRCRDAGEKPLSLWCRRRHFPPDGSESLALCDTIGLGQLDRPDVEVYFPADRCNRHEIAAFSLALAANEIDRQDDVANGDGVLGPGGTRWQASRHEKSTTAPERPVVRWLPVRSEAARHVKSLRPEAQSASARSIRATTRRVMELLVQGDYLSLEQLGGGRGLSAEQLQRALEDYGRHLDMPPGDTLDDLMDVYPIYAHPPGEGERSTWNVDVALWTKEEGHSDLTLQLELTSSGREMCDVVITDLHVL